MKKLFKLMVLGCVVALTTGCANNVKSFRADASISENIKKNVAHNVYLSNVSMPKGDYTGTMCRLDSRIQLPKNMKYSDYIKDAFGKTLQSAGKLSNDSSNAILMDINIDKVAMSSVSGEWSIFGTVTLDGKKTIPVNTVKSFGMTYLANRACNNAARAFDEAVADFVQNAFNKPEMVAYLSGSNKIKVKV